MDYNKLMLLTGIKVAVIFFTSALILVVIAKIVWMNATPGYYRLQGCPGLEHSFRYLSDEQLENEWKKINICPRTVDRIEDTTSYKVNSFFNKLDFNK